jgi:nitroreductase
MRATENVVDTRARNFLTEATRVVEEIAMIKGSEVRKADHPIEPLLLDRWSPRAMSGEEISREELMRLFEAARWAPSSFNAQQWRALYARRATEHWQTFLDLLVDANKSWAINAAVLVVFVSRKTFEHNNEPSITHSYDCGAAWENFALQGFQQGLVVHGMEGFDYERARKELQIPDEFQVEAMAVIGKLGSKEQLPKKLQARESPNDRRKLSESIFEGPFNVNKLNPEPRAPN